MFGKDETGGKAEVIGGLTKKQLTDGHLSAPREVSGRQTLGPVKHEVQLETLCNDITVTLNQEAHVHIFPGRAAWRFCLKLDFCHQTSMDKFDKSTKASNSA